MLDLCAQCISVILILKPISISLQVIILSNLTYYVIQFSNFSNVFFFSLLFNKVDKNLLIGTNAITKTGPFILVYLNPAII